jgi:hypothetical protein
MPRQTSCGGRSRRPTPSSTSRRACCGTPRPNERTRRGRWVTGSTAGPSSSVSSRSRCTTSKSPRSTTSAGSWSRTSTADWCAPGTTRWSSPRSTMRRVGTRTASTSTPASSRRSSRRTPRSSTATVNGDGGASLDSSRLLRPQRVQRHLSDDLARRRHAMPRRFAARVAAADPATWRRSRSPSIRAIVASASARRLVFVPVRNDITHSVHASTSAGTSVS